MNTVTVQRLGILARSTPEAVVVGVVVMPVAGGVECHLEGHGDERDCAAAAVHLLLNAKAMMQREELAVCPETADYLSRTEAAAVALTGDRVVQVVR